MPEKLFSWNDEMIKVLGRGQVTYSEEKNGLIPTCTLTPEERDLIKAEILKNRDGYAACAKFLGRFEDGLPGKDCSKWFASPALQVAEDAEEVRLESKTVDEDFVLHWAEQELEPEYSGRDMVVRSIQGPAKSNVTVFYPYDPTMSKDERENTMVPFWLADWSNRRIWTRDTGDMSMADSYRAQQGILSLIRAVGSIDAAQEWCRAMEIYRKAYEDTHSFNPFDFL